MNWLIPAISSMFLFGLWGFFSKLAINHIDAKSALVFQTIGVIIISILTLSIMKSKPATEYHGIILAILTGASYSAGCLLFFISASRGSLTPVVTLTALYPLITIALSNIILHESISHLQWSGIVFALLAIGCMVL